MKNNTPADKDIKLILCVIMTLFIIAFGILGLCDSCSVPQRFHPSVYEYMFTEDCVEFKLIDEHTKDTMYLYYCTDGIDASASMFFNDKMQFDDSL